MGTERKFGLGDIVKIAETEPELGFGNLEGDVTGIETDGTGIRYKVHVDERWEETYEVEEQHLELVKSRWEVDKPFNLTFINNLIEQLEVIKLRVEGNMDTTKYKDLNNELETAANIIRSSFINTSPEDIRASLEG